VATIDLTALAHNVTVTRQRLSATCCIIAVVKADAYGHGATPISRALLDLGIGRLAVSTVSEGVELREAGIRAPILLLGPLAPDQLSEVIAQNLTPVICDLGLAQALARLLKSSPAPFPVHVKVDTGMGRLGFTPEEVPSGLQADEFKGPLRLEGLLTHLADADGDDPTYTERQLATFKPVIAQAAAAGLSVPLIHAANSAAILAHPSSHFTAVRPGLMLYGYHMLASLSDPVMLKPILTLRTRIAALRAIQPGESVSYNRSFVAKRPSRIAVLPIGYADGYSRALSNRARVLVRGRRAPVVGRVCMDLTMADVTDIPDVQFGDEVILIGRQGQEVITAQDVADWQDSIPYEVLCGLGPRVRREYCGSLG
jgi:alanine racemase